MKPSDETNRDENIPPESVIDLPVPDEQEDQTRGGSGDVTRLRIRVIEMTTS